MITIKRLSECTFEQGLQAWNEGFQGYFFDMTITLDAFAARLAMDGLSPELSVVAFADSRPVGFILNGVRMIEGKKVSWNGGTGVAPDMRGKGIGNALMQASLDIYKREAVDIATLEAIARNETAIALYEKMGYQITDRLGVYNRESGDEQSPFYTDAAHRYQTKYGLPVDLKELPFYRGLAAWQTQWASVRDGESLIAVDESGEAVGYVLYKRMFDQTGTLSGITIYQCDASSGREDRDDIYRYLLDRVYAPWNLQLRRGAFNIPISNELVIKLLEDAGFTLRSEQVYMMRNM